METQTAVTPQRKESSSRTAADSQPIPRSSSLLQGAARQPALGDAARVVHWLNASKGTASHDRVAVIRRELEQLPFEFVTHADAYVHSEGGILRMGEPLGAQRRDWPKEKLRVQRRLHDRHVALNEALKKYVFRPRATYVITRRAWMFGMVPDENMRWFKMHVGYESVAEADAAMSLVRLAETGDLWKVRLCEMCKDRWLNAAKRHYRFCSDHCRDSFYAKSPDYHSRKAANQRKYRENLKRIHSAQGAVWKER